MPDATRADAVQALERFRDDRSRISLTAMGFGWRLALEGRVSEATDEEVRFVLPNGDEALALRVDMDDMVFWTGDPVDVPGEFRRGIQGLDRAPAFVGVALPYRVFPDMLSGPVCDRETRPRERIFFCEVAAEG